MIYNLGVGVFFLLVATFAHAADSVRHKTYKLLREAAVEDGTEVQIASFAYHQEKVATDAAEEFNYSNCKIVSDYLTYLTGKRHWCEEDYLLEFLDWSDT